MSQNTSRVSEGQEKKPMSMLKFVIAFAASMHRVRMELQHPTTEPLSAPGCWKIGQPFNSDGFHAAAQMLIAKLSCITDVL